MGDVRRGVEKGLPKLGDNGGGGGGRGGGGGNGRSSNPLWNPPLCLRMDY